MAKGKLSKQIEEKIEKKLAQKEVELEIDEEINKNLDQELKQDIKQKVASVVKGEILPEQQRSSPSSQGVMQKGGGIVSQIRNCIQRECKIIFFSELVGYVLIVILMLLCLIPLPGVCLERGLLGGGPFLAILVTIVLASVVALAVFYLKNKIALIFTLIASIPLLVLIIILTIQYIGILILGVGILLFFTTVVRRRF